KPDGSSATSRRSPSLSTRGPESSRRGATFNSISAPGGVGAAASCAATKPAASVSKGPTEVGTSWAEGNCASTACVTSAKAKSLVPKSAIRCTSTAKPKTTVMLAARMAPSAAAWCGLMTSLSHPTPTDVYRCRSSHRASTVAVLGQRLGVVPANPGTDGCGGDGGRGVARRSRPHHRALRGDHRRSGPQAQLRPGPRARYLLDHPARRRQLAVLAADHGHRPAGGHLRPLLHVGRRPGTALLHAAAGLHGRDAATCRVR